MILQTSGPPRGGGKLLCYPGLDFLLSLTLLQSAIANQLEYTYDTRVLAVMIKCDRGYCCSVCSVHVFLCCFST